MTVAVLSASACKAGSVKEEELYSSPSAIAPEFVDAVIAADPQTMILPRKVRIAVYMPNAEPGEWLLTPPSNELEFSEVFGNIMFDGNNFPEVFPNENEILPNLNFSEWMVFLDNEALNENISILTDVLLNPEPENLYIDTRSSIFLTISDQDFEQVVRSIRERLGKISKEREISSRCVYFSGRNGRLGRGSSAMVMRLDTIEVDLREDWQFNCFAQFVAENSDLDIKDLSILRAATGFEPSGDAPCQFIKPRPWPTPPGAERPDLSGCPTRPAWHYLFASRILVEDNLKAFTRDAAIAKLEHACAENFSFYNTDRADVLCNF